MTLLEVKMTNQLRAMITKNNLKID